MPYGIQIGNNDFRQGVFESLNADSITREVLNCIEIYIRLNLVADYHL